MRLGDRRGDRLLDLALDQPQPLARRRRRSACSRAPRRAARSTSRCGRPPSCRAHSSWTSAPSSALARPAPSARPCPRTCRRATSCARVAGVRERQRRHHRRAAAPDAALHVVAGDPRPGHVVGRLVDGVHALPWSSCTGCSARRGRGTPARGRAPGRRGAGGRGARGRRGWRSGTRCLRGADVLMPAHRVYEAASTTSSGHAGDHRVAPSAAPAHHVVALAPQLAAILGAAQHAPTARRRAASARPRAGRARSPRARTPPSPPHGCHPPGAPSSSPRHSTVWCQSDRCAFHHNRSDGLCAKLSWKCAALRRDLPVALVEDERAVGLEVHQPRVELPAERQLGEAAGQLDEARVGDARQLGGEALGVGGVLEHVRGDRRTRHSRRRAGARGRPPPRAAWRSWGRTRARSRR